MAYNGTAAQWGTHTRTHISAVQERAVVIEIRVQRVDADGVVEVS
jgi:hypothetical protein